MKQDPKTFRSLNKYWITKPTVQDRLSLPNNVSFTIRHVNKCINLTRSSLHYYPVKIPGWLSLKSSFRQSFPVGQRLFQAHSIVANVAVVVSYHFILFNLFLDQKHNFRKYSHGTIDSLGVPYDYGSIMHYGKRDFAKWPWQTTIKTKNGASIGQRSHLSALDVKQMNLFYDCNKK